jgi:hypothetical protein
MIKYFKKIYNLKIFVRKFGMNKPACLFLFQIVLAKSCGVMKRRKPGRHALLSRGWRLQDKHCITPIPGRRNRLGLTTSCEGSSLILLCSG